MRSPFVFLSRDAGNAGDYTLRWWCGNATADNDGAVQPENSWLQRVERVICMIHCESGIKYSKPLPLRQVPELGNGKRA